MTKFGRFTFREDEPSETYVGDRITLEKGFVKILRDEKDIVGLQTEEVIAVIHLDKGQSVRTLTRTKTKSTL